MTKALKTAKESFDQIESGTKQFDVRKNDREFQKGDKVLFQDYDEESKKYSGKEIAVEVTAVMTSPYVNKGYAVIGFKKVSE